MSADKLKFAVHIMGKFEVWYDSSRFTICEFDYLQISSGNDPDGKVTSPVILPRRASQAGAVLSRPE